MKTFLYTFGLLALALFFGGDALAQNAIVVEPLTSIGEEAGNQAGIGPFIKPIPNRSRESERPLSSPL